jgi:hypothetical protein
MPGRFGESTQPRDTYGYRHLPPMTTELQGIDVRTESCRRTQQPGHPEPGMLITEHGGKRRIVRRIETRDDGTVIVWWNRPTYRWDRPIKLENWRKLVYANDWRIIGKVACGGGEPCPADTPVVGRIIIEPSGRERAVCAVSGDADGDVVLYARPDETPIRRLKCTIESWRRKARRYGWEIKPPPQWGSSEEAS